MTDDDTEESQEMGIAPRLKWAPILAMALLAIELLVLLALVLFRQFPIGISLHR